MSATVTVEQLYQAECTTCAWWGEPLTDEQQAEIEASEHNGEHHESEESDDVFWGRLLGDSDPAAPGKDWAAAAFGPESDDSGSAS